MSLFKDTHFLIIEDDLVSMSTNEELDVSISTEEIQTLVLENGGRFTTRTRVTSKGTIEALRINQVITGTSLFHDYAKAVELMVPMTTPAWLVDTVEHGQRRNYRLYCPKPTPFMDKVVLCIADNLAQGDKEIMYSGVRAFGGQYLDALSRYTTHLVAVDLTNNKSVVAANIKKKEDLDIKIVLPHWVDECMRQQRHVDEQPYLLMNPKVLQSGRPDPSAGGSNESHEDTRLQEGNQLTVLAGKRVFVASDYNLSEHLKTSVQALVKNCGGSVQNDFEPEKIDIYIGKYRLGQQFKTCFSSAKIDVGSLQWLYFVVMNRQYVPPLKSNLLHFPVPDDEILQFKNMRISITGISGDARHYLSTLIVAMGATFTKTLDCNNDFLVCALKSGVKYNAVKTRWPDVKIVNHLWIEESYAKWLFLDPKLPRYTSMGSLTPLLGKARISRADINKIWISDEERPLDVSDSVNEEDGNEELNNDIALTPDVRATPLLSNFSTAANTQDTSNATDPKKTPSREPIDVDSQLVSSPTTGNGRAGRSAKVKASLKLHSNMEDLNQYTSMSKSSRKMKSYMEQLEKSVTPSKKKKDVAVEDEDEVMEPQHKKVKADKEIHLVAIMTGCELFLTLNKTDSSKLTKLGILIVNDYSPRKSIDTIIAPKVLRTEKFLRSLSKAKRIIHPSFLIDVLKRCTSANLSWSDLTKEFNIDHYSLDKVVPVKQINDDLGVSGKKSGLHRLLSQELSPVFKDISLNLSLNLNGGPDLISSILVEHGLSASKTVKLTAGTRKSGLLAMEDGTVILVAHKSKDKKATSHLDGVIVVEWEWCVKSIFHKQVQSYTDYII